MATATMLGIGTRGGSEMTTKTAQHTPGPWNLSENSGHPQGCDFQVTALTPAAPVAYVQGYGKSREVEANARLIAAAPELLEAMEAVIREAKEYDIFGCDHAAGICNCSIAYEIRKAESAIRKARGL